MPKPKIRMDTSSILFPQIQRMLNPYRCDLCQKPISEHQYDHNDGLCPECVAKYA